MSKEKITITRALTKIKTLDKKINKNIMNSVYFTYKVGDDIQLDTQYTPKSDIQSINDLIEKRSTLKAAIMESNTKTKIKILDKHMTVLEALTMKESMEYKKELVSTIRDQHLGNSNKIDSINHNVIKRLDSTINSLSTGGNVDKELIEQTRSSFLTSNQAGLVFIDPSDDKFSMLNFYKELENQIEEFESEIDLVLSESNAVTYIEI